MDTWLSPGGMLAACIVGVAVVAGLGLPGLGLLLAFFVPASAITRGGGRRRAVQVAANGGVAAAAALASRALPGGGAALAFAGALAAAAADTWATEIGALSRRAPRLITTRRPVARGTSGGVTWLGTAGAAAGTLVVAAAAGVLRVISWQGAAAVALAGFVGAAADSLLGATVQARYHCAACGPEGRSETPLHACGRPADFVGGVRWITNDTVNLFATAIGAAVAVLPALAGVPSQF